MKMIESQPGRVLLLLLFSSLFWLSLWFGGSGCLVVFPWVVLLALDLAFPHSFDLFCDRRERGER